MTPRGTDDRHRQLENAFYEYQRLVDSGEQIPPEDFASRYPEIAKQLVSSLRTDSRVRRLAGPTYAEAGPDENSDIDNPAFYAETHCEADASETRQPAGQTSDRLPQQFGRYRIEKTLGEGAMGTVYLAYDEQLDRQVALKVPKFDSTSDPELRERFQREARAVATLHHPNICPVYDVGEIDGQPFISMAYIAGRPLSEHLKATDRRNDRASTWLVRQLALALQEAHGIGVIHRDLKPTNIMVSDKGEPVLMDFGLARRQESGDARITHSGMVIGTPAYMSPEQVDGDPDTLSPASDQYSLGVVLYEMLTGSPPFRGSVLSVIRRIADEAPRSVTESNPDVVPALSAICMRMIEKNPEDRFENMTAVAAALQSVLQNSTRSEPNTEADTKQSNTRRGPNLRRIIGAVLVGMVSLLALSIVLFLKTPEGYVRLEIDDPNVSVEFADRTFRIDDNGTPIEVRPGPHSLKVRRGDLSFTTQKFQVDKDDKVAIRVTWHDGELLAKRGEEILGRDREKVPSPPGHVRPNPDPDGPASLISEDNVVGSRPGELRRIGADSGMELCWCPPGKDLLGSSPGEPGRDPSREEQVSVTFDRGFWIGQTEVTQQQWKNLMTSEPWHEVLRNERWRSPAELQVGANYPAVLVKFDDGDLFCERLTQREREAGRLPDGWEYRLPTEAEWEYACRAGTDIAYWTGDSEPQAAESEWLHRERTPIPARPVATNRPNPWNIYDMHGNVFEWCLDQFQDRRPEGHEPFLRFTSLRKNLRVVRGGRSARRDYGDAVYTHRGFRVVLGKPISLEHPQDDPITLVRTLTGHKGPVSDVEISPDGQFAVSASGAPSDESSARIWNLTTGDEVHRLRHGGSVLAATLSSDGRKVATGGGDHQVKVWDVETGKPTQTYEDPNFNLLVQVLAFSADDKQLLIAGTSSHTVERDGGQRVEKRSEIRMWDLEADKISWSTTASGTTSDAAFCFGGRRVVWCSPDVECSPKIFDATSGEKVKWISRDQILCSDVSPDGRLVTFGFEKRFVDVWDLEAGRQLMDWKWHASRPLDVAFTPDGKYVISGDENGTLRVTDRRTGEEVARKQNPTGSIRTLTVSPDGKHVLTGGGTDRLGRDNGEYALHLWKLPSFMTSGRDEVSQ